MPHGHGRIVALIPAHNEAQVVGVAIDAVASQVDAVIVVADNCTDDTATVAELAGAKVFTTTGNTHRKAGALNQAIAALLPGSYDFLLIVDADSIVAPDFIEHAMAVMSRRTGAVGGVFYGEPGAGLVGQLQRNEYVRYAREVGRRRGKARVLTGTASLFPAHVVAAVAASRPEGRRHFYDRDALTEDMEVTLAIKSLGWNCLSPRDCWVTTEVMPTWADLARQRVRWTRGAFENLRAYGLNSTTLPYFAVQAMMLLGAAAFLAYVALTVVLIDVGGFRVQWPWLAIGAIFLAERVVTVWPERRGRLLALTMLPEMVYDLFQQMILFRCLLDTMTGRRQHWHHVRR